MSTRTEYPNFVGNTGKFLKVNATETDVLWDAVDASDITGVLGIDHGGTGADNATDALNNLLPDQTGHAGEALFTDGTDPYWSAAGAGGGVDTRVYSTGSGALSFNPALGDRFVGLASISSGTETPILAAFGDNVVVKRVMFQVYTGSVNDIIYATLRKNGVDTLTVMAIPALAANQVLSFNVNESYSSTDQYSIKLSSAGTGSLVFTNVETIVQVSGGSPLGVQSVSGNGVNNTDPFNPVINETFLKTKVTVTSAQLLDLHNTPIQLIPAPGAGKAILVNSSVVRLRYNSTPYEWLTAPSTESAFIFINSQNASFTPSVPYYREAQFIVANSVSGTVTQTGLFSATATQINIRTPFQPNSFSSNPNTSNIVENDPIVLEMFSEFGTNALVNGDSEIDIYLTYQEITL